MTNFISFRGTIASIPDFFTGQGDMREGCCQFFTVANDEGLIVNFVVSPATYVIDYEMLAVRDVVTASYDGDAPAILIYPPQYPAPVIVKEKENQLVKVSYFNHYLISSDGDLQLNLSPTTHMMLTNGQRFSRYPGRRDLIVLYRLTIYFSTVSLLETPTAKAASPSLCGVRVGVSNNVVSIVSF